MKYYLIFIAYFLIINVWGYLAMANDKYKSKTGQWRTPEKRLFSIALLGGSLGCTTGMYVFNHKTRKEVFEVGMPLILVIQLAFFKFIMRAF